MCVQAKAREVRDRISVGNFPSRTAGQQRLQNRNQPPNDEGVRIALEIELGDAVIIGPRFRHKPHLAGAPPRP